MEYLIPSIIILLVFVLRIFSGRCFAQREKCMNSSVFEKSSLRTKDYRWYYPFADLKIKADPNFKGSYLLKEKYPQNIEEWRRLASIHLPKIVYKIVNKFRPQWDPFSDFVHYMTFKQQVNDYISIILILVGAFFLMSSSLYFIIFGVLTCLLWIFGYLLGFNKYLKKLTL